jgi:hypothetical protein
MTYFIVAHDSLMTDDDGQPLSFTSQDAAEAKMAELATQWTAKMHVVSEEDWEALRN